MPAFLAGRWEMKAVTDRTRLPALHGFAVWIQPESSITKDLYAPNGSNWILHWTVWREEKV